MFTHRRSPPLSRVTVIHDKLKGFQLAAVIVFLVSGCFQKGAYQYCKNETECLSGRCTNHLCDVSKESEKCKDNTDCGKGQGICKSGFCSKSSQGEECKVNQDCKTEGNFCYLKENQIAGTCMENTFMCKSVAKYKGSLLMSILIAIVIILVLTYIFGTAVLGQTMFTIQGISISALFAIILGVIAVLSINSWFVSNCI